LEQHDPLTAPAQPLTASGEVVMTALVGLLTAAVTAIVLAALGHILLAGIAAVVLSAIAVTLLLFARRAVRRVSNGIRRH